MSTKTEKVIGPVRVRATRPSFYGTGQAGTRIRVGQRFTLEKPEDFSPTWMERIDLSEPDDLQELRDTAGGKQTRRNPMPTVAPSAIGDTGPTGARNVLG